MKPNLFSFRPIVIAVLMIFSLNGETHESPSSLEFSHQVIETFFQNYGGWLQSSSEEQKDLEISYRDSKGNLQTLRRTELLRSLEDAFLYALEDHSTTTCGAHCKEALSLQEALYRKKPHLLKERSIAAFQMFHGFLSRFFSFLFLKAPKKIGDFIRFTLFGKERLKTLNDLYQNGKHQTKFWVKSAVEISMTYLTQTYVEWGITGITLLVVSWPIWTAVSETVEHMFLGPVAAFCLISQVYYFAKFKQGLEVVDFLKSILSYSSSSTEKLKIPINAFRSLHQTKKIAHKIKKIISYHDSQNAKFTHFLSAAIPKDFGFEISGASNLRKVDFKNLIQFLFHPEDYSSSNQKIISRRMSTEVNFLERDVAQIFNTSLLPLRIQKISEIQVTLETISLLLQSKLKEKELSLSEKFQLTMRAARIEKMRRKVSFTLQSEALSSKATASTLPHQLQQLVWSILSLQQKLSKIIDLKEKKYLLTSFDRELLELKNNLDHFKKGKELSCSSLFYL
ncbi:MAG: hypothetical protein CL678_17360 [Bdellovibrionaceae bacterium]|nr:hypothetical protein [Pseudobdellovibrionaceae bacterium]|tara:strand:+ start:5543 stop:7069 length:1527 start_codon:yes stop_codon:yes gene_type:complete